VSAGALWVISPIYLDVESFLILRSEILAVLDGLPRSFDPVQFVAVDDSAGFDPQVQRLRDLADVIVVEPPFNLGHQRALVYALRSLADRIPDSGYVVTMDGDGEDRPADLPRLLSPLLAHASDTRRVALARRTKRRESLPFKALYLLFRTLFRALTGIVVRSGNYVAYRGWLARRLLFHPHFDLCYSSSFISLNLKLDHVPAERGTRYAGVSRMSYSKLVMHGIRMLLPFTDRIAIRALVAFASTFGVASLLLVAAVLARSVGAVPEWALYLPVLAMTLCFVAAGNLILLFAAFVQSRGTLLKNLEREMYGRRDVAVPASRAAPVAAHETPPDGPSS
jgi:hypothetical protein